MDKIGLRQRKNGGKYIFKLGISEWGGALHKIINN